MPPSDESAPSKKSPAEKLGNDRRQVDRRQADRQGKYDRRRNRCVHCVHFQEDPRSGQGMCLFHHESMAALAFACVNFEALESRSEEAP